MTSRNRGVKKPKLRDLSGAWPNRKEADALLDSIADDKQHHVTVAILGAALLDYELESRIRKRFPKASDDDWAELTGRDGPFSNFSSKIMAAYAMGIISKSLRDALDTVRAIRNAFAHAKTPLSLDHELVGKELSGITLPDAKKSVLYKNLHEIKAGKDWSNHHRFVGLCIIVSLDLARKDTKALKKQTRYLKRKTQRVKAASASETSPLQGLFGSTFRSGHSGDHSPLTLARALAEYQPPKEGVLGALGYAEQILETSKKK